MIDYRDLNRRTASRQASPTTLSRIRCFFHKLVFKSVESSPYDYIRSPKAKEVGKEKKSERGKLNDGVKEKEPWHWHTKQRHMMKAELDDAFKLRKWVVLVLAALCVVLSVCLGGGLVIACYWFGGSSGGRML